MRFAHHLVAAISAVLMLGCSSGGTGSDSAVNASTRQDVVRRMDDYLAAARADQAAALPDYWTDSAQVFEPESEFHSRAAMMSMVTDFLKAYKLAKMSLTTRDIFVHDRGMVAYQYGSVDETLESRDGKAPAMHERLNFVARWVKQPDGVWRMDRFMETPMPKDSAAAKPK